MLCRRRRRARPDVPRCTETAQRGRLALPAPPASGWNLRRQRPVPLHPQPRRPPLQLAVRLQEAKRAGLLGTVGYLPEFTGLPHLRPDALVGLLPPSKDHDDARRYFVEIELSRKDSARLDEKLTAYTEAWRRSSWRRFPRVLFLAGSSSRFPSDARYIYREIEGAIRRQPGDARHVFALTTYDDAVRVLLGTADPLILSVSDDPQKVDILDPIQLVLPVDLDKPRASEPPGTDPGLAD